MLRTVLAATHVRFPAYGFLILAACARAASAQTLPACPFEASIVVRDEPATVIQGNTVVYNTWQVDVFGLSATITGSAQATGAENPSQFSGVFSALGASKAAYLVLRSSTGSLPSSLPVQIVQEQTGVTSLLNEPSYPFASYLDEVHAGPACTGGAGSECTRSDQLPTDTWSQVNTGRLTLSVVPGYPYQVEFPVTIAGLGIAIQNGPGKGATVAQADLTARVSVTFPGLPPGLSQCSPPPPSCQLTGLTLEPYSDQRTTNPRLDPHQAGGFKIFPEKVSHDDSFGTERRLVRVRAVGAPAGSTIYFRRLDVDDPSDDLTIDPNGPHREDNIDLGDSGIVSTTAGFLDIDVGASPGDNYRFVASCTQAALANPDVALSAPPGVVVSPLLTVWRSFWIELDRMKPVHDNLDSLVVRNVVSFPRLSAQLITFDAPIGFDQVRYRSGARLIVPNGPAYPLTLRTASSALVYGAPNLIRGQQVAIIDDDNLEGENSDLADNGQIELRDGSIVTRNGSPLPVPDFSYVERAFAPAYIRPRLQVNPTPEHEFEANIPADKDALDAYLSSRFETRFDLNHREDDYWDAYVLIAYQPDRYRDGDGDASLGGRGLPGGIGAAVFAESAADVFRRAGDPCWSLKAALTHELGHVITGSDHDPTGIMVDGKNCKAFSEEFAPLSIAIMRSVPFLHDARRDETRGSQP